MTTHGFRLVHLCHVPCDEKKPHPCHEEGCAERINAAYPAIPPSNTEMSRQCSFHKVEIPDTQECPLCVLRDERDEARSQLASATDLLNTWAREMQVPEAYDETDIKGVIDRLWTNLSKRLFASREAAPVAETPVAELKRFSDHLRLAYPNLCRDRLDPIIANLVRAEAARASASNRGHPLPFPVTDPNFDAPDGAEITYRRVGDSWEYIDPQFEKCASVQTTADKPGAPK